MSKVTLKNISEAPNLKQLKETFGVSEDETIVAYGDAIYSPKTGISKDLLIHELTHCERQGFNARSAERWWKKYMEDPVFRLQEEVAAYKAQYEFCRRVYQDRNRRAKILWALASELSSDHYGKICTHSEAMQLLCV